MAETLYHPLDPQEIFWAPIRPEEPAADDERRYTPLDPKGIFWRHADTEAIEPPVYAYNPEGSYAIAPASPEVAAYTAALEHQQLLDAAHAEATLEYAEHNRQEAYRNRLGAIGILAYAHPEITDREDAVAQRIAFENRDTSAAVYLTNFARETLAARVMPAARKFGRMAVNLINTLGKKPARTAEPDMHLSDGDLAFLRSYGDYQREQHNRIDPMTMVPSPSNV